MVELNWNAWPTARLCSVAVVRTNGGVLGTIVDASVTAGSPDNVKSDGVPETGALPPQVVEYVAVYVNDVVVGAVQTQYVVPATGPVRPRADKKTMGCPTVRLCGTAVVSAFEDAADETRATGRAPIFSVTVLGVPDTVADVQSAGHVKVAVYVNIVVVSIEHT